MKRQRRGGPSEPGELLADIAATCAPNARSVRVGFSGGADSTLLLACALEVWPRRRVSAIHVHHGWHEQADAWAEHCRRTARALGSHCEVVHVDARAQRGEGPEAAARDARYAAFVQRLCSDDVLLTGHHREDQAETLLLALLRGGGLHGWQGMPLSRRLGSGTQMRPWLSVARQTILDELKRRGLDYLEDPANLDPAHDRVWLRQEVLPALRRRWPEVSATLARASEQAGEAAACVSTLAAHDYVACRGWFDGTLAIGELARLPIARQRTLLRWWLLREGLSRPPAARLETLREQLVHAAANRVPHVHWTGGEVFGWKGLAWAVRPRPAIDAGAVFAWTDRTRPLDLPHRSLAPGELADLGIAVDADTRVEISFPRGGERFRLTGTDRPEPLRELLRRYGVPPWERDRIPLVYVEGRWVAIVGVGHGEGLQWETYDAGDSSAD